MRPWLLIPVKSLEFGKSRLAQVVKDDARRHLNEFLLRRVLTTGCTFPGPDRTAVVSGCDQVLRIAREHGVRAIQEKGTRDLNAAVAQGVVVLRHLGAKDILLVACDEPVVRPIDLRAVARRGAQLGTFILCPDRHHRGTNAIYLPSSAPIRFQFGEASLAKHVREISRTGFTPHVHFNRRIALDIDMPADLPLWRSYGDGWPSGRAIASSLPALIHELIWTIAGQTGPVNLNGAPLAGPHDRQSAPGLRRSQLGQDVLAE